MEHLIDIFAHALVLSVLLSSIPLGVGLIVGFIVSVLQAATQIQEQTLTFVPKLAAICLALYLLGPWMVEKMELYLSTVLDGIAEM